MKRFFPCFLAFALFCALFMTPAQAIDSPRSSQIGEMANLGSAGNYSGCIALADKILSEDASFMEAYRYKSLCYFYMDDWQKAYDTLKIQLQYNPLDQTALYNAACAASLLGLDEKAIDLLEISVQLDTFEKVYIGTETAFDSLRFNPRYQKLMEISIVVGGELLDLDVPPMITQGHTLIPLRAAFEALDADIEWDAAARTVSCVYEDISMRIVIDNNIAKINGVDVEMDVAATIVNGRTLVPIRFVAETLNAIVDWDEYSRTVFVDMMAPEGTANLASQKETLTNGTAVLAIDGGFVEPYQLDVTTGCIFVVAKSKDAFNAMNALNSKDRAQYMADTVFDYFGYVIGCDPVYMYFAYNGKIYYAGLFVYDEYEKIPSALVYFRNGKLLNIVKQYKNEMNYKDFYSLPDDQRTSTTLAD